MYDNTDDLVEQRLEELVALPIGLKPIVSFDGMIIYGSKSLNQKFLDGIEKSKYKKIAPTLQKAIEKEKFYPGFYSKNLFSFISRKFLGSNKRRGILGFYSLLHDMIVIIIDENSKWGSVDNDLMGSLTVHEAMHMFSYNKPSQFFAMFKEELIEYYYIIFKDIFKLKEKPKNMNEIPKYIYFKLEKGRMHLGWNYIFKWYSDMMNRDVRAYSKLSDEEWEKTLNVFLLTLKLYWISPKTLKSNLKIFTPILFSLRNAYKSLYGSALRGDNFYAQEIGIPSEVIAIRSEIKPDSKIIKAFNQIV